jgi:hypothetical protein
MKFEISVTEAAEVIKEIQGQPGKLLINPAIK